MFIKEICQIQCSKITIINCYKILLSVLKDILYYIVIECFYKVHNISENLDFISYFSVEKNCFQFHLVFKSYIIYVTDNVATENFKKMYKLCRKGRFILPDK